MINDEDLFIILSKEILLLSDAQKSNPVTKLIYHHSSLNFTEQYHFLTQHINQINISVLKEHKSKFFHLLNLLLISYYLGNIYYFNYKNTIQKEILDSFVISNLDIEKNSKFFLINFDGFFLINKDLDKNKSITKRFFWGNQIDELGKNDFKIILTNNDYFELFNETIEFIFNKIKAIESIIFDFYFNLSKDLTESYIISNPTIKSFFNKLIYSNSSQIDEWRENFTIDDKDNSDISSLIKNGYYINSLFFSNEEIEKMLLKCNLTQNSKLNAFDGLLIHGENLQGLNYLRENYKVHIDCIYIDPPYNTGSGSFLYQDDYGKIAWYWLLENRLRLAYELLKEDGVLFISIDDNELVTVRNILDEIFDRFVGMYVWHKKTQPSFLNKELISVTEYILVYKKGLNSISMKGGFTDPNKHTELLNISNEVTQRNLPNTNTLIYSNGKLFSGIVEQGVYGNNKLQVTLKNTITVTQGISDSNIELIGRFRWTQSKIDSIYLENRQIVIKNLKTLRPTVSGTGKEKIRPPITLLSKKINSIPTTTDGNFEMKNLYKIAPFYYPKPVGLIKFLIDSITYNDKNAVILDFFAGSGTTGHAVINLNRDDGGKRKFILIEQADYFDSILVPRIKKILYTDNWNKGLPRNKNSISAIIKVITLKEKSLENF